jgi:integrase
MKNTINLYEDKRRSKLYVRYRINGTSRDETLQLEWHSNVWMDKHIKINNKSKKLAEEFVFSKRMELFKSDNALDFIENQNKSFISFYKKIAYERGNNSKVTLDGYNSALKKLKDYLNTLGIADVTFKQVNESFSSSFKAHLEGRLDIGDTTKQKYFKTFKYVTAQAFNQGYHQRFVCKNIRGITGEYQRHDYLTPEEFKSMYDTPTPFMDKTQTRRFFIFSCLTGLPHRECMNLKWKDFYSEKNKSGIKNYFYNYKREKTSKHYKNPLSKDAVDYIRILWETKSCKEYVFPALKYSAHENNKLQTWANMSDVKKKISPHCARATFANLFVRVDGSNVMDLKELMGHKEVKTTLSYIGTSLKEKTDAVMRMPRLLKDSKDNWS